MMDVWNLYDGLFDCSVFYYEIESASQVVLFSSN